MLYNQNTELSRGGDLIFGRKWQRKKDLSYFNNRGLSLFYFITLGSRHQFSVTQGQGKFFLYVVKWYLVKKKFMLCIEQIQRFHRFHWYLVIFTPCLYPFLLILSSNGINWLICDLRDIQQVFCLFFYWFHSLMYMHDQFFFKKYFYKVNLLCFTFWADSVFCNMKI